MHRKGMRGRPATVKQQDDAVRNVELRQHWMASRHGNRLTLADADEMCAAVLVLCKRIEANRW